MFKITYLDSIGQILDENGNLIVGIRKYFTSPQDAQQYVNTQYEAAKTPDKRAFWSLLVKGYYLEKE